MLVHSAEILDHPHLSLLTGGSFRDAVTIPYWAVLRSRESTDKRNNQETIISAGSLIRSLSDDLEVCRRAAGCTSLSARALLARETRDGNDIDTLAWGKTDSILMGASNDSSLAQTDYLLSADSSGVSLLSSGPSNFNAVGAYIHSDFGTGLVYSDDGNVADPTTGQVVGTINASGIVVPDSSVNRIFVFTQSQAQANTNDYTIASFDETTYVLVSTITVQNLLGAPFSMGRCGNHCLAVLTFNGNWSSYGGPVGMLYLISDSTFVDGTSQGAVPAIRAKGDLAMRWKRPSRSEIVRSQRFRRKD